MAKSKPPEIVTFNRTQLEELLTQLQQQLAPATYQLVESLLRTLQWVLGVLEQKSASVRRLRRIIFGAKTETTRNLLDTSTAGSSGGAPPQTKPKGHGRKAAQDYPGARRVQVAHPKHRVGDLCPKCLKGKLYWLEVPARLVRIVAQPIFQATIYELERLRCALCGALFTAPPPAEAGLQKYDPNVGIMLGLLRYGAGFPMYRIAKWQQHLGVPLPAATQWELLEAAAETPQLVYQALIVCAAQGQLLHNDDTHMRVQDLRQEIAQAGDQAERTGIFTTGVVAQVGTHRVAVFFTGQQHAGENLGQLLQHRAAQLAQPLQMCDGLARNEPKEFQTLVANCLLHARRQFVEVKEDFPEECRVVLESLREVYRFEALAKKDQLSDQQRLSFHQQHSQPVMTRLQAWMQEQLDQKKVEPNSGLGEAINYMLKRWKLLTRFLSIPGAPLDNNIVERALKRAILHRKNSLSYKTLNGARVGDVFMSLIHTCELNRVNPFEYLNTLQQHAPEVAKDPGRWLPWEYQQALASAGSG